MLNWEQPTDSSWFEKCSANLDQSQSLFGPGCCLVELTVEWDPSPEGSDAIPQGFKMETFHHAYGWGQGQPPSEMVVPSPSKQSSWYDID